MAFSLHSIQLKKTPVAIAACAFAIASASAIFAVLWSVWLGLLGVVGFAVLVMTVLKPSWFFTVIYPSTIMIGQVPLYIGELMFGEVNISLERLLVIVGGIGLVGGIFMTKQLRMYPLPKSVFFGTLMLLITYLAATLLMPADDGPTLVLALYQKAILFYFAFISFRDPKELYTAVKLFLVASFIASFFTLWVYFTEGSLTVIRGASYNPDEIGFDLSLVRGLARAGAGNTMALWLATGMLWQATGKGSRAVWFMAILWFGLLSLFALRREALVTIALGLAWLLWRYPGRHRRYIVLLTLFIVAALGLFIAASPEWMDRLLGETVEEFESGSDARMALLFRFTPTAFINSPFIGYGPGNYGITQLHFPETVTSQILYFGGAAPHNSWSAAAIEAGAGALVGFCLMLWGIGRPLFRTPKIEDMKLMALWSIAPLVFFQLLMSLFFGDALKLTVIWFWFGFLLALERMTQKNTS